VAFPNPRLIVPAHRLGAARACLRATAATVLAAAGLALAGHARAGDIARQVYDIEARSGNDPEQVIAQLRPLEASARANGGDDLRAFLAAWGYSHGFIDKPAVAEAAVEELTELGERIHNPAALASARTPAPTCAIGSR